MVVEKKPANPAFPWVPPPLDPDEDRSTRATDIPLDVEAQTLLEISGVLNRAALTLRELEERGEQYSPYYLSRLRHYETFLHESSCGVAETMTRHGYAPHWPHTLPERPARPTRKPISDKLRYEILERSNFRCVYCGGAAPEARLQIEHVIPIARGGGSDGENLVAACTRCNHGKGTR